MAPSRDREDMGEDPGDEPVLSPDELDFSSAERVAEIEEGRFVIGADGPPETEQTAEPGTDASDAGAERARTLEDLDRANSTDASSFLDDTSGDRPTGREVKRWMTAELDRTDSQYAYRIAAKSGTSVSHQQLASDDIGTAFDGLLRWYARQVADGTPVEDALGILLAESSIRVRYPISGMLAYLEANDLDSEDSIADLLAAIRESDGLVFPLRPRR